VFGMGVWWCFEDGRIGDRSGMRVGCLVCLFGEKFIPMLGTTGSWRSAWRLTIRGSACDDDSVPAMILTDFWAAAAAVGAANMYFYNET
jgi:hypothetical protein